MLLDNGETGPGAAMSSERQGVVSDPLGSQLHFSAHGEHGTLPHWPPGLTRAQGAWCCAWGGAGGGGRVGCVGRQRVWLSLDVQFGWIYAGKDIARLPGVQSTLKRMV